MVPETGIRVSMAEPNERDREVRDRVAYLLHRGEQNAVNGAIADYREEIEREAASRRVTPSTTSQAEVRLSPEVAAAAVRILERFVAASRRKAHKDFAAADNERLLVLDAIEFLRRGL